MAVCPELSLRTRIARAAKRRPASELAVLGLFGPAASLLVAPLLRLRVLPPTVVLANAAVGLAAAGVLAAGELVAAAILLQAKTLLDNADGLLARAAGRASLLGRYLDTEADLAVNAAVFAALGAATGEPWLALAAFLALTVVLSVDFNLAALTREAHGEPEEPLPETGARLERALALAYRLLFAPQDRLVRALSARRLERLLAGAEGERAGAATLAYHDRGTAAVLANLGLSTQLLVLGLFLAFGRPEAYLWLVPASVLLLPLLQLRRERLARSALGR
jgi:phosphatidylglycerophosphate synthase